MTIEAIYDDYEGFRILARGQEPSSEMLRLYFGSALSYRATDESSLIFYERTDISTLNRYGFFEVTESEYLAWFHKANQGISDTVSHYALYLSNQCIDVISASPPEAGWL